MAKKIHILWPEWYRQDLLERDPHLDKRTHHSWCGLATGRNEFWTKRWIPDRSYLFGTKAEATCRICLRIAAENERFSPDAAYDGIVCGIASLSHV